MARLTIRPSKSTMLPMGTSQDRKMAMIPGGLALLLVLGGLIFGLFGRHVANRNAAIQTWPSTTGTLKGCGLVAFRNSNDPREQQNLETSYAYTVAGRQYGLTRSEWYGYATGVSHETPALCKGKESVPLYFNPDDPNDAVLTRDGGPTTLPFFLAILVALLSAPLWYITYRTAR